MLMWNCHAKNRAYLFKTEIDICLKLLLGLDLCVGVGRGHLFFFSENIKRIKHSFPFINVCQARV